MLLLTAALALCMLTAAGLPLLSWNCHRQAQRACPGGIDEIRADFVCSYRCAATTAAPQSP